MVHVFAEILSFIRFILEGQSLTILLTGVNVGSDLQR